MAESNFALASVVNEELEVLLGSAGSLNEWHGKANGIHASGACRTDYGLKSVGFLVESTMLPKRWLRYDDCLSTGVQSRPTRARVIPAAHHRLSLPSPAVPHLRIADRRTNSDSGKHRRSNRRTQRTFLCSSPTFNELLYSTIFAKDVHIKSRDAAPPDHD